MYNTTKFIFTGMKLPPVCNFYEPWQVRYENEACCFKQPCNESVMEMDVIIKSLRCWHSLILSVITALGPFSFLFFSCPTHFCHQRVSSPLVLPVRFCWTPPIYLLCLLKFYKYTYSFMNSIVMVFHKLKKNTYQ